MVRTNNEDSVNIFKNDDALLAIVADGMGGHNAGEVASRLVIEHFEKAWKKFSSNQVTSLSAEEWLEKETRLANELVFHHASRHAECQGMGTTVVAVICTAKFVSIAHIGDSRCYLYNRIGFHQMTEDHSYVNYLVKSGGISREDAEHHPRKNVLTRVLGTESSVEVDVKTVMFEQGDKLLICSDGLYAQVEQAKIERELKLDKSLEEITNTLIEMAKESGGDDNISVVLLQQSNVREGEKE